MKAYTAAGYTGDAIKNAFHITEKDGIKARIAAIKAEDEAESRAFARMSKATKLELLEGIAKRKNAKDNDRIAAIKVHNEMTGDNEPTVTVVDAGPNTLESIRERTKTMTSVMSMAYLAR